jgi:hypothetical protein
MHIHSGTTTMSKILEVYKLHCGKAKSLPFDFGHYPTPWPTIGGVFSGRQVEQLMLEKLV